MKGFLTEELVKVILNSSPIAKAEQMNLLTSDSLNVSLPLRIQLLVF